MNDHLQALPAGHRLGEYRIERVLGSGGFGITYYAWDVHLDKPVAIKEYLPNEFALRADATTVKPKSTADQSNYQWGLERFLEEARTLARFKNPYLNEVHRLFEDNGTAYIVLEYIEGETLSQILRREGRLDAARLARLLEELLSGLEEVHKAGFVHRDIKPSNIMLRENGAAVLLDFGAARQAVGRRSKSITSILTPGYAPIEQYDLKGDDIGPWTDLYALGMVAYRCISGISDTDLPDAVGRARLERKGEQNKDLTPAVELGKGRYDAALLKAVDWAIRMDEDQRPPSVAAIREALAGGDAPGAATMAAEAEPQLPKSAGNTAENKKKLEPPKPNAMAVVGAVGAVAVAGAIAGLAVLQVWGEIYWLNVHCNEAATVQLYLERYPDGRHTQEAKVCLARASKKRFAEIFKRDASPHSQDADGFTDLHYSVAANMPELTRLLLDTGAHVSAKTKADGKPISEITKKTLQKLTKAPAIIFDNFPRQGQTPLHFAVLSHAPDIAELLLSYGANVQEKDKDNQTPLHYAASENAHYTARLLISHGADVHAKGKDNETPLHNAAFVNAHDTTRLLISHGADVHAKENNNWTPLHNAAFVNAHDTARLLISHGADVHATDNRGNTPLHLAALRNARNTALLLISRGANVQAKDEDGWTPLHDAAVFNAHETAQVLISRGANIHAKDKDGVTPKDLAISRNHTKMAQLLR